MASKGAANPCPITADILVLCQFPFTTEMSWLHPHSPSPQSSVGKQIPPPACIGYGKTSKLFLR
jgi:hypothetical protein